MPIKLCLEPRCPNPAHHRGRCPDHTRQRNRSHRQTKAIYHTKRWLILRRHILHHNPICQHCDNTLATQVDHITPIEHGGDPWSPTNCQALCGPCHARKTRGEQHVH